MARNSHRLLLPLVTYCRHNLTAGSCRPYVVETLGSVIELFPYCKDCTCIAWKFSSSRIAFTPHLMHVPPGGACLFGFSRFSKRRFVPIDFPQGRNFSAKFGD